MIVKKLFTIAAFCMLILACAKHKDEVELVQPSEFENSVGESNVQLIDVRTPKEYKSGHIANAKNMHIYDKDFEQRLDSLDKNETVYVYCQSGGRSSEAVEILKSKNFIHIVELKGGMGAWTEMNKPVD